MKNFLKKLVVALLLMNLALTMQAAFADEPEAAEESAEGESAEGEEIHLPPSQSSGAFSPIEMLRDVGEKTNLPNFDTTGVHPDTFDIKPGIATVTSPVYFALDIFRYAISAIAFLVVIIAAIKLVSTSTEEEAAKQKTALLTGVIGLLIIQLADVIVKKMFFGEQGEAFEDLGTVQFFAEESVSQIRGIIGFLQMLLGAAAVLVIVIRGFTLVYDAGDEESMQTAKTHVTYGLVGLVVVALSEIIVRGFVFPAGGSELPNLNVGRSILIGLTNYLSGFMALFAFLTLFFAGYRYVISGGNEEVNEKVKKTLLGAVIALVLALGAFALVNTFVTLDKTVGPEANPISSNYLL